MSQNHVQEHIDLIARHEHDFLVRRTLAERLGDSIARFAGNLSFVCIHLFIFAVWIIVNTLSVVRIRHFDPEPYSLLATLVALEAILLASIILMRQSRMSRRAEERDHLMLQLLLLTEKELTAVLSMERQVADRVGLQKIANEREIEELSQRTSIDEVAQTIKERLPPE